MTLIDKLQAIARQEDGEFKELLDETIFILNEFYICNKIIANDYVELSHDKVMWQRNDHMKRCKKMIELYHMYDDENEETK